MKKIFFTGNVAALLRGTLLSAMVLCAGCATNPLTGKSTMAFVGNDTLFPQSFAEYEAFLSENTVITNTPDAAMVERMGDKIKTAAEKWFAADGKSDALKDYRWEYHLVDSPEINAWCMPGGKIVVYTGILPVTQNEDALATVMGHEVAHALLNHGQQRMSANVLQQVGAAGVSILTQGSENQELFMTAYGVGSSVAGTLPFSREHETEADEYGLTLMTIAGYNPEAAVPFWERMAALGGSTPELLSTHPSDEKRVSNIKAWIPGARTKAAEINAR
jgi:predicted Zn-dependent protease